MSPPLAIHAALLFALATGAACASRRVPEAAPPASAASASAPETPRATVTAALQSDPPLPGKRDPRWPGLQDPAPGTPAAPHGDHQHQHEHHDHAQPAPGGAGHAH